MAEAKTKILVLLNKIAKEQKLQDHEIILTPISSGGANYTSTLYTATISSKNSDDLHVFIKVAALVDKMRNDTTLKIYEIENFIYTELHASYRRLEDKHGVAEKDRLNIPKYYGASTVPMEEIMVLENLVSRGFSTHDRMKSVDWEYAVAATRELAKFHALSMAIEHEDPEEFTKFKQYFQYDSMGLEGMDVFFASGKKAAMKVVCEENYEKLRKFLDGLDYMKMWTHGTPKREVLIHGDICPSNLMHRTRDDGSVEMILVDYQMMRSGGPVVDLFYFIFLGTDKQFRAHYYEKLVDHYYSELRAALTRLGLNPDEKYSREDFDAELKDRLPFGLAVAVFSLPIVTVEAEHAPTVDENMDLTSFSIENTSSLYPERLNGVVDDFVRWGVL